jgi:hypothetical protein
MYESHGNDWTIMTCMIFSTGKYFRNISNAHTSEGSFHLEPCEVHTIYLVVTTLQSLTCTRKDTNT